VQAPELQHDEEQEEDDGTDRVQQVLPLLSQAHAAQGDEIASARGNFKVESKFELTLHFVVCTLKLKK
jgi:hypothetical protein